MEMEDHQYGMADLRQFMSGRPHFPVIQPPPTSELFSGHRSLNSGQHLEMMMVGRQVSDLIPRGLHEFRVDSATTSANTNNIAPSSSMFSGLEAETGCLGGDGGTGRWPRQETLTLLEIRSRLDPKFKEANQKGPLWDEVSRIMSEEHGYQRSGKKCREKFENLYKYYKKTKEGKAGRQDGKHYRFFRQLEALCGETSNPVLSVPETHLLPNNLCFHSATNTSTQANQDAYTHAAQKHSDSLSLSNSSEFDTNSSDDNNLSTNDSIEKRRKRRGGRGWKAKIKDFIDSQMRKLMEKQEAWLEKMMKTLEQKEQERLLREEEWRKEEAARIDREHKFWAKERAWIEARDASLMEALHKLTGRELKRASSPPPPDDQDDVTAAVIRNQSENQIEDQKSASWAESEITRLIQVRASMETSGCSEEAMWEEVATKMACLGYDRSALMCRNKWDSIKNYLRKAKECNKKRKENSRSSCYFQNNDQLSLYNQTNAYNCDVSSPSNSNASNAVNESCFRFLMGDGENLWENYGLNLNKGEN